MIPLAFVLAASAAVLFASARFVEALRSLEDAGDPDDVAFDAYVSEAMAVVNTERRDDLAVRRHGRR